VDRRAGFVRIATRVISVGHDLYTGHLFVFPTLHRTHPTQPLCEVDRGVLGPRRMDGGQVVRWRRTGDRGPEEMMPAALPTGVRQSVVDAHENREISYREFAERFGVVEASVSR
jgi:hypothetical protein